MLLTLSNFECLPVMNVFLQALCVVAARYQRTGLPRRSANLHPGCLGQTLVVSLHVIDNHSPLAGGVDGSEWCDVGGGTGAQICLLIQLHQSVHAVVSVGEYVLVEGRYPGVVVFNGIGDIVCRVISILKAPSEAGVEAAGRRSLVLWDWRGRAGIGVDWGGRGVAVSGVVTKGSVRTVVSVVSVVVRRGTVAVVSWAGCYRSSIFRGHHVNWGWRWLVTGGRGHQQEDSQGQGLK